MKNWYIPFGDSMNPVKTEINSSEIIFCLLDLSKYVLKGTDIIFNRHYI